MQTLSDAAARGGSSCATCCRTGENVHRLKSGGRVSCRRPPAYLAALWMMPLASAWPSRYQTPYHRARCRLGADASTNMYTRERPCMCGVIGIFLADNTAPVAHELYDGLTLLQHRGQDAAGISTSDAQKLYIHKDQGLARDVFGAEKMAGLQGSYGVGHVRYPTAGLNTVAEAQPFLNNVPLGFTVAHNGHITNVQDLRDQLSVCCHLNTDSDTEVLAQLFGQELLLRYNQGGLRSLSTNALTPEMLFEVVQAVMNKCRGGFAVVLTLNGHGVLAFRDPHGIRPLCFGNRRSESTGKMDWAVASESVAFTGLGFGLRRDLRAGEAVFVDSWGVMHHKCCLPQRRHAPRFSPCLFEYVYMARPDSVLDGVSVYQARVEMGKRLALKIRQKLPRLGAGDALDIDVVVPVPETSRIAAVHCAASLGVPYEEGLTKNRYIGRTFIMAGQEVRFQNVRKKLSAVRSVLQGKSVLLVDDSIVRGTTSKQIIQLVRDAGARRVYFCSASPPVRHANVYGIDLPSQGELVAYGLDEDEVAEAIGADQVVYQDLHQLEESVRTLNPKLQNFESSVFSGQYVTDDIISTGEDVWSTGGLPGRGARGSKSSGSSVTVVDVI